MQSSDYLNISCKQIPFGNPATEIPPARFELTTFGLGIRRSIQLSYEGGWCRRESLDDVWHYVEGQLHPQCWRTRIISYVLVRTLNQKSLRISSTSAEWLTSTALTTPSLSSSQTLGFFETPQKRINGLFHDRCCGFGKKTC